jgi:hypothetical protein
LFTTTSNNLFYNKVSLFANIFLATKYTFCGDDLKRISLPGRKQKKVYKNKTNNIKTMILLSNYFAAPPQPRQTAALWPTLLHFRQMMFDFAGGRLAFGPALGVLDQCPPLAAAWIAKRTSLSSPVALLASSKLPAALPCE